MLSTAAHAVGGPEHDALRRLEHESNAKRAVPLVITDATQEPGIFGILRPVLVWPSALSQRLTAAQIDAILSHELAHVRRLDNLSSSVHAVVQALFWFHPFVWWIGTQLSATREQACDEAVVASGHDRCTYAESILRTCEFRVEASVTALAGATSANLTQRIADIMNEQQHTALDRTKRLMLTLLTGLAVAAPIALGGLTGSRVFAQIPSPARAGDTPAFDVATIKKRSSPDGPVRLVGCAANGRLIVENYPIEETILVAYGLDKFQLMGARGWVQSDRYDIEAKAPARCQPGEGLLMLRALLADRFGLTMHVETRQVPIYELVVIRKDRTFGPQLTHSEERCAELWRQFDRGGSRPSTSGAAPCQRAIRNASDHISLRLTRMRTFAKDILGRRVGRTVIDQTGFDTDDLFDMELSFAPDTLVALATDSSPVTDDRPSLFTALEEQLGLKLVPRVGPAEVMVIDSITRPTEN
jgi:uncharacterized protein (TIGR03435 family)